MKSPPAIIAQLIHIYGPMKGEIQEFSEGAISIGRNPGSSLCFPLEMTGLSRRHAEIIREGNQFRLTDHSTNGTYVNGKKVKESLLRDGDVLEFSEGGPKVSFLTKIIDAPVKTNKEILTAEDAIKPDAKPVEFQQPDREPVAAHVPDAKDPQASSQPPTSDCLDRIGNGNHRHIELASQKVSVPLVIQYGPAIRSFRELPVIIGKKPGSDFVISLPSILDQHMQILFFQSQYWIKDLSGQNQIKINNINIDFQAPLHLNDIISLTDQGPAFCFLGEGRLAEVESQRIEAPSTASKQEIDATGASEGKPSVSFWSKFKNKF